ncbi:MAG: formylglycine-generating enzyme family protein [Polyangiaceae bacterium]|nr:formylglycine-generating enzyme family protein [Polyangiaceae bacterium]
MRDFRPVRSRLLVVVVGVTGLAASQVGACGRQFNDCAETYTCPPPVTGGASGAASLGGNGHAGGAMGLSGAGGVSSAGGSVGAAGSGGVGVGGESGSSGAPPSLSGGAGGVSAGGGSQSAGGAGATLRVPACTGADINARICGANTVVQCTGAQVGQEVERCVSKACVAGSCVGVCQPGTTSCIQANSSTCSVLGDWGTPVSGTGCKGTGVSCAGLAANCGPLGNESCCERPLVPGQAVNPPILARLDKFEVTVGRFANFVAAFDAWQGAGGPLTTAGWMGVWTPMVATDAAALLSSSQCQSGEGTWSLASAEAAKPMNCVSWYNAQAFCHWDGGKLALENEWQFAATPMSGGTFPWGATAPGNSTSLAVHGCWLDGVAGCSGLEIAPVGSVPAGNGPYGHADLAGNLAEWVQDAAGIDGQTRGGSWASDVSTLNITQSVKFEPTMGHKSVGFRCSYPL